MQVTLSVFGRFHAFDLARELHRLGALRQIVTSYPRFAAASHGVPESKVASVVVPEALTRLARRLPLGERLKTEADYWASALFERLASERLDAKADIVVGWSGFSRAVLRRAKEQGAVTVLERHSCHMAMQQELLTREYALHGLKFEATHPRLVEKELQEYKEADFICVPSLFVKRSFEQRGLNPKKLLHVPLGVDLSQFRPAGKKQSARPFRIVHCGTVSIRKGIPYLLEAFKQAQLPASELWLIGPVAPEMEPILAKYASDAVKVLGRRPSCELAELFAQCDALCLASVEDGFGLVIPQAMACGLPVVCTRNTCGEDLIRDGKEGFIVDIQSAVAIADKFVWLYENRPRAEEMGAEARLRAEQSFTWKTYGEAMLAQYRKILATQNPASLSADAFA